MRAIDPGRARGRGQVVAAPAQQVLEVPALEPPARLFERHTRLGQHDGVAKARHLTVDDLFRATIQGSGRPADGCDAPKPNTATSQRFKILLSEAKNDPAQQKQKEQDTGGAWQYSVVYSFTGTPDAAFSYSGMLADGAGNLFGTTVHGGEDNDGAVFRFVP